MNINVIKRTAADEELDFDYAVIATYSEYMNMYIMGVATDLFEFNWELLSQGEQNDESTRASLPALFEDISSVQTTELYFKSDELSPRGQYTIELTVEDIQHYVETQ